MALLPCSFAFDLRRVFDEYRIWQRRQQSFHCTMSNTISIISLQQMIHTFFPCLWILVLSQLRLYRLKMTRSYELYGNVSGAVYGLKCELLFILRAYAICANENHIIYRVYACSFSGTTSSWLRIETKFNRCSRHFWLAVFWNWFNSI